MKVFSRGWSVGPSDLHIFEFLAVFALLLLPNCPRLDCCVSSLVICQSRESFYDGMVSHYSELLMILSALLRQNEDYPRNLTQWFIMV